MYLSIILLPLISSLIATNRKCGKIVGPIISVFSMQLAVICCILIFYEVGINNASVNLNLGPWIDLGPILIEWSFLFDAQTVSMYQPIVIISFLIQIYSLEYMGSDPYKSRFLSLLSLFTFTMQCLVSGENLLIIFLGWEGNLECLKSFNILQFIKTPKINSNQRVGPHNIDILSVIYGTLLGDGHLEKRGNSYRLKFTQSNKNVEFLTWFLSFFSYRGYCSLAKIKLTRRAPSKYRNKPTFEYNFISYSFSSLKSIHSDFYKKNKGVKIMPTISNLYLYFTPLALAVLFQSDGYAVKGSGAKIALNNFTKEEVQLFAKFLTSHYNLKTSLHIGKIVPNDSSRNYIIYIYKESLPILSELIKPYMVESMYYKLNGY